MEVHRLHLTDVTLPSEHPRAGVTVPVFGYLVQHADGPVLVDTGVGQEHPLIEDLFRPVHHPMDEALGRHGVTFGDVVMVINTHLHFDHAGQNPLFPDVPVVAQRVEYELASNPGYTVPEWVDHPAASWRLVDGTHEVVPGITVFATPGHTDGHQSVLVDVEGQAVIIAGQTLYDPDELEREASLEPLTDVEALQTARSARRIKEAEPSLVLFSHDDRVWPLRS